MNLKIESKLLLALKVVSKILSEIEIFVRKNEA